MPLFRPGEFCGRFEIIRLLGTGGYAEVYEVITPTRERRALKVIATSDGIASKLHARLAQEGAALGSIIHANVVRIFDVGVWEDRVWILLELVDGVSLQDKLRPGAALPPLEDVLLWIQQACEGIAEAHRVGIVHRDLKPGNILITAGGMVKVIDFGIAKLGSWGVKTTSEHQLGTAMYMSPEQCRREPADPRMDVYSMGLVLYEAISGRHPMGTTPRNMLHIVSWQLHEQPRPLREVAPEVPGDLEALVHAAIEKNPARRLPSMRALADGLREMLLRMQVSQRRAALNVPSFSHDRALAPTAPMRVFDAPEPASSPPPTSSSSPSSARGGTIPMPVYSGPPAPATPRTAAAPANDTAAPGPASGARIASTTIVISEGPASEDRVALLPIDTSPTIASPASAPTMVSRPSTPSSPAAAERRTSLPVASSVTPSLPGRHRRPIIAMIAVAVTVAGAAAASWMLWGPSRGPTSAASGRAKTPSAVVTPSPPPTPTTSATAPPASTAATSASSLEPPRKVRTPVRPRDGMPAKTPAAKNRLFDAER